MTDNPARQLLITQTLRDLERLRDNIEWNIVPGKYETAEHIKLMKDYFKVKYNLELEALKILREESLWVV